jgi:hypothetical protein
MAIAWRSPSAESALSSEQPNGLASAWQVSTTPERLAGSQFRDAGKRCLLR